MNLRRRISIALALGIGACATQQVARVIQRGPAEATLKITIEGLQSTEGELRVALFENEDGFPSEVEKSVRQDIQPVQGEVHVVEMDHLPTGAYAVSVWHDEEADGEMATDFLGRPKEGIGISNDAKSTFGPPSFDDARVELPVGETDIVIHMRY